MPKSWAEYLEEHDNDATRAGEAAARDVANRERENGNARTFRRTFKPVLQELDIPTTREGAQALIERLDSAADTSTRVPQGGLALTAEQRPLWEAYQQQLREGEQVLTPQQIRERLNQGAQAVQREQLRTVTDAAGARTSVLQDRLRATNLRVELRNRTENGQPVRDAQGQPVRDARVIETVNGQEQDRGVLREYAQSHWTDYVEALFPQGGQGQSQQQSTGTVITGQTGAGNDGTVPTVNPITAALQQNRPATGQTVLSAFDFSPSQPTGGNA